jgi:beta-lactamase regulating signal transducer with metallopeptidase domain
MSAEPLMLLGQSAWWSTIALLLVLVLRRPFIRGFGVRAAVLLWLLVPLASLAALLPARTVTGDGPPGSATVLQLAGAPFMQPVATRAALQGQDLAPVVLVLWSGGVAVFATLLAWRQRRLRRVLGPLDRVRGPLSRARRPLAGPLVLGFVRPVIVVPPDFRQRFDRRARRLMLAHEFMHLRRHDPLWNAAAAALRCAFWFNPLVHWGAVRFRRDQELVCDACVLQARRHERKTYARALLALEAESASSAALAFGPHPLKERIRMIATNAYPSAARAMLGRGTAVLLAAALAAVAWASNPQVSGEPLGDRGSQGERFAVDVEVTVDGRTGVGSLTVQGDVAIVSFESRPRMLAERMLTLEHEAPDEGWSAVVTVERITDDRFRIAAEISRNGDLVSTPIMIVAAGSPAFVKTADPETGRPAYRLSFTPRPVSALEASAVGARPGE